MLGLLKKINRITVEKLEWIFLEEDDRKFISTSYPQSECWLQMNDFPEEPLWTLYYKGETKDIEDTPTLWKINYKNK